MTDTRLHLGDCLDFLRTLDSGSVDAVVTSPPYDSLRRYNGYRFEFEATADQLSRVVAEGGVIVWVVADQTTNGDESGTSFRQALHFKSLGLRLHDTMIFAKRNPAPLSHNRYEPAFEYMFVFSAGAPKTFNPLMEKSVTVGQKTRGTKRHDLHNATPKHGAGKPVKEWKVRPNVWTYPIGCEGVRDHPAVFPVALATDHVLSWTNEGGAVLDPFMGSGTTGVACVNTGRRFIGAEIDPGYFAIAERRVAAAQAARAELLIA